MRRDYSLPLPLISVLLLLSSLSYGQSWTGILAPSRAVDWSRAGLPATFPDGEAAANPWTPPARTQCGSTLSPLGSGQNDVPQIVTALSGCTTGHYVLLGAGTFTIGTNFYLSPGYLSGHNNISLRGSGPQTTKLNVNSGGAIQIGAASGGGSCTLTSGSNYAPGSTVVTCSGSTPPTNQPAWITQCDTGRSGSGCSTGADADNGGLWICANQTICSNQTANGSDHAHQQQTVLVTNVSGTCSSSCTVTISPGLFMPNWAFANSPTISWNDPTYTSIGMGLEDLTIDFTAGSTSNNGGFSVGNTYASWIKGVRFIGPNAGSCCAIYMSSMGNSLFMSNYLFTANPKTLVGAGLPVQWGHDSGTLMLNNVWHNGGGINDLEGSGYASGNVLAYNYARDSVTSQVYNGDAEHFGGIAYILREGNEFAFANDDATWGTHDFDTFFRNYYSCDDPPFGGLAAPKGIVMDNFARFENAIGNALGTSGAAKCTTYSSTSVGSIFQFGGSDALSQTTSMRWGNYDTVNAAVRWVSAEVPSTLSSLLAAFSNPVPSSQSLPPSFFMNSMTAHANGGTGLSWWKVCTSWTTFPTTCASSQTQPMPPIGPDVTGGNNINGFAYDIPAALAYKNLPIDATYQSSFTITGSSWSGGTETLTVSGLPSSSSHTMGGFQLSGVNAACLPSSGASYTGRPDGELLMTGSSTTTISYAVASNPNTSCTGTFKFPDVRQFDERVYQNDGGGSSSVNPATNPTAGPR